MADRSVDPDDLSAGKGSNAPSAESNAACMSDRGVHSPGFFQRLRQHMVVQWTLAYAAGAYTLLHATEMFAGAFGWTHHVLRLIALVLLLGGPIVATLAWFHGHRGRRRITSAELLALTVLLAASGAVLWFLGRPADRQSVATAGTALHGPREAPEVANVALSVPSIAVLPARFSASDLAPFYSQIVGELIRILERNSTIRLASLDAVDALPESIAEEVAATRLGVRYLVSSTVSQSPSGVTLAVSLFDSSASKEIWSQQFDDVKSPLAVDAMARAILAEIHGSPTIVTYANVDSRAYEAYLKARQYAAVDDEQQAERLYREALSIDPGFALALAGLCNQLARRYGNLQTPTLFEEAERLCHRAWTRDPQALEVQYALGALYFQAGEMEKARGAFEAALRINPHHVGASVGLAQTYETKQPNVAESELKRIIEENPGSPSAYQALAYTYFRNGRYAEMIEPARWVVKLQPQSEMATVNLAVALMCAGVFGEAKMLLLEMHNAGSKHPDVDNNLATAVFLEGDFAGAADLYRRAADLTPDSHYRQRNLGDAIWHAKGKEAAVPIFRKTAELAQKALEINPSDGFALGNLLVASASLGDQERYASALRSLLALYPDDPQFQYDAAVAASRLGDMEAAADHARNALDHGWPVAWLNADPDIAAIGVPLDPDGSKRPETLKTQ